MKIIKQGNDPQKKLLTGDCLNCKAVVEFYPFEAKLETDRNMTFYSIKCPCCPATITVSN